uniref:DUF4220 domain-containing protein n=1 Tax=Oryza brachyantha TaxID=4533 RepID=J3N9L9_ORYBR
MMNAAAVVSNFIFKWSQEKYILLRFRILMATLMVVYLLVVYTTYVAPMYLGERVSSLRRTQAGSDALLLYVLGAMQAAPMRYPLFPAWAIALVSFRSSARGLSERYSTHIELGNVAKLLVVAYMNASRGTRIGRAPLWIFWGLLLLKCFYRIVTCQQASDTLWNGRSSELLQACMGPDQDPSNFDDGTSSSSSSSPDGDMEGCRYLIYGESEPEEFSCTCSKTSRDLDINNLRSPVTLQRCVRAFKEDPCVDPRYNLNFVCLPFALSRLLRCRLEGATLHAGTVSMNRKLLIHHSYKEKELDLFDILERDVLFLKHCLLTNFPMICSYGLLSLGSGFILAALKFSVALWLSGDFFSAARHQLSENRSKHNLSATDLNITGVAILFTALCDGQEITKCFLSRWTRLVVLCSWVKNLNSIWKASLSRCIIPLTVVVHTEFGHMDQYAFLESFSHSASKCGLLHSLTGEMTADGKKLTLPIKIPGQVKTEVLSEALQGLRNLDYVHSLSRECFAPVQHDANAEAPAEQYWSEIIQTAGASGCSRVILVWHIATSLCEMKLAQEHGVDLSRKPGCLHFSRTCQRIRYLGRPYGPYLLDKKMLDDELWKKYLVANSLSRYCAYLLVSKPDLLPGNIWVSNKAFQQTLLCARKMLHGCKSLQDKYDKLIATSQEEDKAVSATDEGSEILLQGANLAKILICHEGKERQWEILAKVWARLLLHLSPSSNAQAHANAFESKYSPELITIIWALFSHCGIDKSELWDVAPSDLVPGPSEQTTQQPAAESQETTGPSDAQVHNIHLWSTSRQLAGDLEDGGGEIQEVSKHGG